MKRGKRTKAELGAMAQYLRPGEAWVSTRGRPSTRTIESVTAGAVVWAAQGRNGRRDVTAIEDLPNAWKPVALKMAPPPEVPTRGLPVDRLGRLEAKLDQVLAKLGRVSSRKVAASASTRTPRGYTKLVVMNALKTGPKTKAELCRLSGVRAQGVGALLSVLERSRQVVRDGDEYRARAWALGAYQVEHEHAPVGHETQSPGVVRSGMLAQAPQ